MRNLSPGNTKLGHAVASWSIPAYMTCPGASVTCLRHCYALRKRFKKGPVFDAHLANLDFTYDPAFVPHLTAQIKQYRYRALRIHVAGDFFSEEYIENWSKIIKACSHTTFFFYTRSWRQEHLLPGLIALGSIPNVEPWWSQDLSTGPPPMIRGFRTAYMAIDDFDASRAPTTCDLVFRDDPQSIMKKANGVQVCPTETGIEKLENYITCTNCRICWRQDRQKVSDTLYGPLETGTLEIIAPAKSQPRKLEHRPYHA